ncbi:MAG: hypothetical protein AAF160_21085 [Pseudomonadota bacterium]
MALYTQPTEALAGAHQSPASNEARPFRIDCRTATRMQQYLGDDTVMAGAEHGGDLIMRPENALGLGGRVEPVSDRPALSCRRARHLGAIVQALLRAVIGPGRRGADRLEVAVQIIGDNHQRLAEVIDQMCLGRVSDDLAGEARVIQSR